MISARNIRRLVLGHWPFFGHSSLVIGLLLILISLPACTTTTDAKPTPDTQRMPGVPSVDYPADIDTLANHLLPAALSQMHWAKLQLTNQVTALRLTALTPADQNVEIRAQNIGHGRSAIQIQVGYFGDEQLERAFHVTMQDVIRKWQANSKR